jgi:hypothetical protein
MKTDQQFGQPRPIAPGETVVKQSSANGAGPLNITGAVNAILEVGRQRKVVLNQLRAALQSGDDSQALDLARQLCGLQNEESNRVNPRFN